MSKRIILAVFAVLIIAALTETAAIAQVATATLVGTVRDSSGAVVPAVKVSVVNSETSFRSETTTSAEGDYRLPYLNPGSYQITLEAAGFKRYIRDGVMTRAGETPRLDITMELGAVTEQVEVSANASLISTDSTVVGNILDNNSSNSVLVKVESPQGEVVRYLDYFPNVESYHVAGLRTRALAYSLDGVNAKTPGTNALNATDAIDLPNADAIESIAVNTSGMTADYGHSAGGAMNLVFKTGTNAVHGTLDERYVWRRLAHRDYLTEARTDIPLYYNWFNGSFSGPVYIPKLYDGKNRTFFLFAFGGIQQSGGQPRMFLSVPTDAMKSGNFAFGPNALTIYNPYTMRQNAAGTWISDPFPGNQIPANLFDPVAKNFLSHDPWAKPNNAGISTATGTQQNFIINQPKVLQRYATDAKIDHQFSTQHKIFGRFSEMTEPVWYSGGNYLAQIAWTLIDPNHRSLPTTNYNGVLSDTFIFGPNRFNDFRLGFNRRTVVTISNTDDKNWSKELGIPNMSELGFPVFNNGYYLSSLSGSNQTGQELTLQDNFNQVMGKHTIKVGYELMRTTYNSLQASQPSGTYNFGGTQAPFTPNTGNGFADFLLGTVTSAVYTKNFATWLPRWWHHSLYVMDDWKPMRGLTLNLGLRWSYESPFTTKYGQQSQFDPTKVDPLTGLLGAITHPKGPLAKSDWNNFQPRLGVAWTFRPKWVFRTSFGIITQDLTTSGVNQNFNEYQGTANVQQLPGDPRPAFTLSQGPPKFSYPVQADGSAAFVGTNYSARNADWFDPNSRMPYTIMWSAGIQHEFVHNWLVELNYQGNAGVGLLENWNINQIPLNISTNTTVLNQIFSAIQNYRPYPQFGAVTLYSNFGHSTYHAGTLRVEKRYTRGLTFTALYTFAKALNDCDNDGGCNGVTVYNRSLEKGRAGYDVRQHFQNTFSYDVPLGKGQRFLNRGGILNQIVGGWTFSSTWAVETGSPASITYAGSPNRYLPQGVSRPNAVSPDYVTKNWTIGPNRFPTSAQKPYLQFSSFAYPAAFTVGTMGRNTYEGPAMNAIRLWLAKTWNLTERVKFNLRWEGNNFPFKQPELSNPNGTYNSNSANLFGTFTGLRNPFAEVGQSRPHSVLGARIEF